jgi:capsular polysaccharide transport system ATP-binding protein
MILLERVCKSYKVNGRMRPVLTDINLRIDPHERIALFGRNGAGKSTLIRLIAGVEAPTSGRIERNCLMSWPLALTGGVLTTLSGRENAEYVARIHGVRDVQPLLEKIKSFSELGPKFEDPVQTYSSGMRARFSFSLSVAFEFDIYLIDEATSVGDPQFKKKAKAEFERLANRSGLIMVTHDVETARRFCTRGAVIADGAITEYPTLDEAIAVYENA